MTTSTLVALWKNPEACADDRAAHPAGEITPSLGRVELPRVRRALALSGFVTPKLGASDGGIEGTADWSTLTSISFTEN
ncbi:hypothetical protein ACIQF6_02430 [Kitasatospora sp. NPDC092948]|uniref:hypothetical protein n=1 Tax=Kitasatospora sp. NPDC092948 TaxID=3364088 RepID=UPI0037FF2E98